MKTYSIMGIDVTLEHLPRGEKMSYQDQEIERLRLEIIQLKRDHAGDKEEIDWLHSEIDRLRVDHDRVSQGWDEAQRNSNAFYAENSKLRDALESYRACCHGGIDCPCTKTAREALGG